jgi:O-antigen/teichoic acid export membrane protein
MTDIRASTQIRAEKRVSSNALSYMAGQAAMAVFGFVSGIVLARYLPKNTFGQYSYLLALAIVFLPLLDLGTHSLYTARAARERDKIGVYWARALALKLYALPILAMMLAGYFAMVSHMLGGLFWTVLFYIAAQSLLLSTDIVFRAAEQGRAWAIRRTIYETISLALILAAITILDARTAASLLLFASIAVALAAAWAVTASVRMTGLTRAQFLSAIREPLRRDEIKALLPFAVSTLLWVLFYRETNILLEYLGTRIDLADYRVAFLVMTAALYLPRAVTWASVPRIALHHAELDDGAFRRMMSKAVRANFYIAAFVVTAGALYGERLIGLAFGPKYMHLGLIWQVFNLLLGAMFVLQFCMDLLNALHQERRLAYALVGGIVVLTALDLFAIPHYGTAGGAAAQLAACLVILPISLVPFVRWVRPSAALVPALKLVAVVVVCGAAGFALRKASFFLSLVAFAPLFAIVSHLIGAMPEPVARPLWHLLKLLRIDLPESQSASPTSSDLRDVSDTAPQSVSTP